MKNFTLLFFSLLISTSLLAQKLPFQGQLIENGAPVTGTVELVFSIPDGEGGSLWSESHGSVAVVDGLYSVVLGSVTPLPTNLFSAADERQLNISVNGTALAPVTIYASLGAGSNPEFFKDQNSGTAEDIAAVKGEATGSGVWSTETGFTSYSGVFGVGNALSGGNAGVRGLSFSHLGNPGFSYGVYGVVNPAEGNTTGTVYGVRGDAVGAFDYAVAVRGLASNEKAEGVNIGGDFSATSNPTENIGIRGISVFPNETSRNIGVFGRANGGAENWAGWFDGPVKITGDLKANFFGSYNPNALGENMGDWRVLTGFNYFDLNSDNGLISVFGPRDDGEGKRALLVSRGATSADSYGELELDGYQGQPTAILTGANQHGALNLFKRGHQLPLVETGAFPNDMEGLYHGGRLWLRGTGSDEPLVNLRVDRWQDGSEHGYLTLKSTTGQEYHIGPNGGGVAGVGFGDKSWEEGLQGFYHMYGDTPEGKDSYRGGIEVNRDAEGNTSGALNLHGPVFSDPNNPNYPRGFVHANVRRDPNGEAPNEWAGYIDLNGQESPNIFIGANSYQDSDLGSITLFGNQPDANNWWHSHATLSVGAQNGQQYGQLSLMGNNGKENITMGAKAWEMNGTNPGNRPYLKMRGNTPDFDLLWMDVQDDGNGLETSGINFRRSDNQQEFNVGTNGFSSHFNGMNLLTFNVSTVGDNSSGNLSLGSTTAGHGIRMYGGHDLNGIKSHIALDGPDNSYVYLWGEGNISATGNISSPNITQLSDRSLKENITPLKNSLSNTLKLRGVSYNWIDKSKSQKDQIGVIAQEVEEVYPEFVHTNAEGVKSVNYSQMVAVLIEAIKELNTQIETLKTENASLKTELAKASDNEKRISELEASMKSLIGLVQQNKSAVESTPAIGSQE